MINTEPYPWQRQQWQALTNLLFKQQLPHALLLKGIAGLGKYDFAMSFAKFALCESQTDFQACNTCKTCNLFEKQNHPDFFCVKPEEEGKALKVDQIKSLVSKMTAASQYNGYKVCLIYPAEAMNISAANALLKNLEEPVSAKTLYLLVTGQAMLLPATIRSRCQQINFNPPNVDAIKNWLVTKHIDFGETEFKTALILSQNAPLKLLEQLSSESIDRELFNDLTNYIQRQVLTIPEFIKKYTNLPVKKFILTLQLAVAQTIKSSLDAAKRNPGTVFPDSASLHPGYFAILDSLNYHKAISSKNITLNSQLLIENYLIKLANQRDFV